MKVPLPNDAHYNLAAAMRLVPAVDRLAAILAEFWDFEAWIKPHNGSAGVFADFLADGGDHRCDLIYALRKFE